MAIIIPNVHRTYKYRLYSGEHTAPLYDAINISGIIWNHLTALQRRYYRLFGKHISLNRMFEHIGKLRMKTQRFSYWRKVGSQAVQDICKRHEAAYQRFFNKKGGLPRFKKVKKYTSFTLTQAGWSLGKDSHKRGSKKHPKWTGHLTLLGQEYKFVKHRPMQGEVKTVTVKRDAAGRLWVCFSVVEDMEIEDGASTGKSGGFDFGLKQFLTTDEGDQIDAPEYFKADLPRMRRIQAQVSKKKDGSGNKKSGQQHLARRHVRIADKRRDFHFQLAHELCKHYDVLIFEDLNLDGMKRLWGRKVSDLGFAKFLKIMQWVGFKHNKSVLFVDRWERTTQKCSACPHRQSMELKDRIFCCEKCGLTLDRDHNAARNILEVGHRLILSQSREDPAARRGTRR